MNHLLPDLNSPLCELEKFSDVGAIVTDLDGTFIKQDGDVLGQLKGIQQQFSHRAITVTIATGRTYTGAKEIANQMKIKKGTPIALYNGAIVLPYQVNNILFRKTIPNSVLKELCTKMDLNHQYLLAYYCMSDDGQDIQETVHGFGPGKPEKDVNGMPILWHTKDDLEHLFPTGKEFTSNFSFGDSLFSRDVEPCSILIDWRLLGDQIEEVAQYLDQCPLISCTRSGSVFWEIRANGVHKGIIFEYLNRSGKRVAVGDNDNDIELLKEADIGVVVANGSPAAKAVAQYECQENGTLGVLELVRTIKEANRYC